MPVEREQSQRSRSRRLLAASTTSAGFGAIAAVVQVLAILSDGVATAATLRYLISPVGIAAIASGVLVIGLMLVLIRAIMIRRRYFATFTIADIDDDNLRDLFTDIAKENQAFTREIARHGDEPDLR